MTGALLGDVTTPTVDSEGDHTLEGTALAGIAAIQRLIAERNSLRNCATLQKRELESLKAVNEDLSRRINLLRRQYLEVGSKIVSHLEQFQQTTSDPEINATSDAVSLKALGQRLKQASFE